jgi:hypothetical protein
MKLPGSTLMPCRNQIRPKNTKMMPGYSVRHAFPLLADSLTRSSRMKQPLIRSVAYNLNTESI